MPTLRTQPGACGSATVTLVRVTLPVLVTVMVKVAVPPGATYCKGGCLSMLRPGRATTTSALSWSVGGWAPGIGTPL